MKNKLNRLYAILHELQMDEMDEGSLSKIGEARCLVNELVKNLSMPVVSDCFCNDCDKELTGNGYAVNELHLCIDCANNR